MIFSSANKVKEEETFNLIIYLFISIGFDFNSSSNLIKTLIYIIPFT